MNEGQILEIGQAWAAAERREDVAALDDLLDDDFVAVGPRGFILNREQWLDRYRSGSLENDAFDWQDVSVRHYGDAAVAIGVQTQQAAHQGHQTSGRFRVSHVYVRKGDRWLIANIQLSGPIPDIPPG
jgi:ketosteroid isomerase-like protein